MWARNVEQPQSRQQCLDTLNLVQIKNRVSDEPSTPSVSNAPFSPGAPGELCSSEPGELCSGEPGELFSGRQQWVLAAGTTLKNTGFTALTGQEEEVLSWSR